MGQEHRPNLVFLEKEFQRVFEKKEILQIINYVSLKNRDLQPLFELNHQAFITSLIARFLFRRSGPPSRIDFKLVI